MKGVILSAGYAKRLYPSTIACTKQILPIYDKPMIYYPLSVLMLAGIREIIIITSPRDLELFKRIFPDNGKSFGIDIQFDVQKEQRGIADAFIVAEKFIGEDNVALILGDNFFYGKGLESVLADAGTFKSGAKIFCIEVPNPCDFGVAEVNDGREVLSIEEKPKNPKSNYAVTGLYFYDNDVIKIAKTIEPSARGEIEITDVNKVYLSRKKLTAEFLNRDFAWLDTGTHKTLLEASNFVEKVQREGGKYIGCPEEIAYRKNYITREQLLELSKDIKSEYGSYLKSLAEK